MGRIGLPELFIILFIVVLIFGANRLPQLATGIGKSIRNFKDGMKEGDDTTSRTPSAARVPAFCRSRRPGRCLRRFVASALLLFRPRLAVARPAAPLIGPHRFENLHQSQDRSAGDPCRRGRPALRTRSPS